MELHGQAGSGALPYHGLSLLGFRGIGVGCLTGEDGGEHEGPSVDELDKGGTFAKGLNFLVVNHGVSVGGVGMVLPEFLLRAPHRGDHFSEVLPSFGFVNVLQLDVISRLGFHVRESAGQGEDVVGSVEAGDGVGNEPEI